MNDMNKWLEQRRKKQMMWEKFCTIIFIGFVLFMCALGMGVL